MTVFGELYGGGYPHPDVPPQYRKAPVQKGVYYSPEVAFAGFHIQVGDRFLPQAVAFELLKDAGVRTVPVLFEGCYEDCLATSHRLLGSDDTNRSVVPDQLHGLPLLPNNRREGHVIAPSRRLLPVSLSAKSTDGAHNLVKHVHPQFRESLGDMTGAARAKAAAAYAGPPAVPKGLPKDAATAAAWAELVKHVTMMRAEKTVGKFGMDRSLISDIVKMMVSVLRLGLLVCRFLRQ